MLSFAALADPTRREIVELLASGELPAGDIGRRFPISAPAVSQHLRMLREAGLVQVRVEGQRRIYRLNPDGLAAVDAWLDKMRSFWSRRLDRLDQELRQGEHR